MPKRKVRKCVIALLLLRSEGNDDCELLRETTATIMAEIGDVPLVGEMVLIHLDRWLHARS